MTFFHIRLSLSANISWVFDTAVLQFLILNSAEKKKKLLQCSLEQVTSRLRAEGIDPSNDGQCQAPLVPKIIYKVPLLSCSFLSPQRVPDMGRISVVYRIRCKSHLQSNPVIAPFCYLGAFHTFQPPNSIIAAGLLISIYPRMSRFLLSCSFLLWNGHLPTIFHFYTGIHVHTSCPVSCYSL